jgi:hypothetical protein
MSPGRGARRPGLPVAAACAEVAAALVTAADVMGVDVAADLLDVSKAEVHRARKAAQRADN